MKLKHLYITLVIVALIVLVIIINYFRVTKQKKQNPVRSMLFIGDSNTAAHFSYADQLRQMLPGVTIKKIAKDGEKTDWMLSELRKELAVNKYDAVSILGGSNDVYALNKIDSAMLNLSSMYALAKQSGAQVIAISPPNKNFYVNRTEQKQRLLQDLVSWIKENPVKDYFINFHELTNNKSYFSSTDGYLHAQAPVHRILAQEVIKKIV